MRHAANLRGYVNNESCHKESSGALTGRAVFSSKRCEFIIRTSVETVIPNCSFYLLTSGSVFLLSPSCQTSSHW